MSSTKIGVGSDAAAGREIRAVTVAAMSRHGSIRFGTDSSRISSGIRLPREGDVLSIDPSTVRGDSAFGSPPSQTVASACTTLTSAKQSAPTKAFSNRLTMRRMHHRTELRSCAWFRPMGQSDFVEPPTASESRRLTSGSERGGTSLALAQNPSSRSGMSLVSMSLSPNCESCSGVSGFSYRLLMVSLPVGQHRCNARLLD